VEHVPWVDESDRVIAIVSRQRMRSERLRHRAVFVAVTDGAGRLLVHRRSLAKDVWPGWCDIAVGGVVAAGESYDDAARREVAEEIGVHDASVTPLDDGVVTMYDDEMVSLLGRCYQVVSGGPFAFTDGEITEASWVDRDDLATAITRDRFLPDSLALLLPVIRWRASPFSGWMGPSLRASHTSGHRTKQSFKRSTSVSIGSLIGADPDQLESLGTTLCRQRESVESIVSLVTSTFAGTAWVGPARQAFESDWESSFRSALSRLSDAFDMAGRDCSARAIELRRVMGRM